ncbi:hypothetical protein M3689_01130 [Alkalihalophilus marmarensis]|uniref:pyocin knob domain-containing protein n=1 Tax=Alkalihalophilus marmarensis TaxID=521377 RepID=UPI0020423742|nr:hypothetical protein [Alkalihalophilus marmarensis]MCM3487902.1 hypothetical protein [Alkalihalophilus marmarensis]
MDPITLKQAKKYTDEKIKSVDNNAAAEYAMQQGDYAKAEAGKVQPKLDEVESVLSSANQTIESMEQATLEANQSADYALEQGDYAKNQGSLVEGKLEEADQAISTANQSATNADEKANLVDSKLNEVNLKIIDVDEALTDINDSTNLADQAANHAETQGQYAKDQGDYAKQQGDLIQDALDGNLVTSVNGKSGEVSLTAEDIGAITTIDVQSIVGVHADDTMQHVTFIPRMLSDDPGTDYPVGISIHEVISATNEGYPLQLGVVFSYKVNNLRFTQFMYSHTQPLTFTRVWYNGEWSNWIQLESTSGAQAKVDTHENKKNNPHSVTKTQVGLENVDNVQQASKTEFDEHAENNDVHITSTERTTWNGKQNALGYTPVNKAGDTMSGRLDLFNCTERFSSSTTSSLWTANPLLGTGVYWEFPSSTNKTFRISESFLPPQGSITSYTLVIKQYSTPASVLWDFNVFWKDGEIPDVSGANKTYVLTFVTYDQGATWLGFLAGEF